MVLALSAISGAGEIPITGIEAFHQGDSLDGDGSFLKAIDGSGMDMIDPDDPSTWTVASTAWADDWQGFSADNTGDNTWVVMDLGAPVAGLSTMYLWNVQEGNALDRGVKDFEVFYATNPALSPPVTGGTVTPYSFTSGGWTSIGDAELEMGIQNGDAGQAYDISDAAGARYIGLKLTSNHGGFRTGLAEVAFSDVADPDAITPGEIGPPDPPVEPGEGKVVPIAEVFAFHQGDSFDANGSILKIADGSGMAKVDSEDPSTWTISSTAWADDWQGFSADNSADNTWAIIDLGAPTIGLDQMYLWNVQEGNALDRGTSTFDIYYATLPTETIPVQSGAVTPYSFGGGGWTQLSTGNNLAQGIQFGDPGEVFDISGASGARYIGLHLTANHGGIRTGLAEVAITSEGAGAREDDDGDGLLNGWEKAYGFDPESDQGDDGAEGDPDGDGLSNLEEQTAGTSPLLADSDGDGYGDEVETDTGVFVDLTNTGTSPIKNDTDNDGLLDGAEDNSAIFVDEDQSGSNPLKSDTDDDGLNDGYEVSNSLNPNDDGTTDVNNGAAGDPDSDNSGNLAEFQRGTDPQNDDSDEDGILDGYEDNTGIWVSATQTGTDPLDPDSDDDTLLDGVETNDGNFGGAGATGSNPNAHDTDADGYFDEQELAGNTDPSDPSSKPQFPTPLGFWSFDDQGETVTADLSPNGNNGTVLGNATYVEGHSGIPGDFAIDLDGIYDAVTTSMTLDNIGEFTMAGWIRFPFDQANRSGLFGQNDILEFGFSAPSNVHLWSNPGGALNTPLSPSEEWVHIAFVGDSTGRTIFINGEAVVTGNAATPLNASDFFFNIGGAGVFDATGNHFLGQINDVGVWEVSMGPQLIKGLADGTISPVPGLGGGGLEILSFSRNGNQLSFVVGGTVAGTTYALEESDGLLDPWLELNDFVGAGGANETTVTAPIFPPAAAKKFYRVRNLDDE